MQMASGNGGGDLSMLRCDKANIILECLKPAEDGSGDLILRLYESNHEQTNCVLHLSLPFSKILETDMLEGNGVEVPFIEGDCDCCGAEVDLAFRPFEIKTLRLKA